MAFSVGIGLTNECNLRCPHCYRPDMQLTRLTLHDVRQICDSIPVKSMNLGVGENGFHPEYRAILAYLAQRGITTSITSNSASIQMLPDNEVRQFHSVEFSLDFPTESEHDAFRGPGNWHAVMVASERCVCLGVPVTITAVMMRSNYDKLAPLAAVAARLGANLRVNIYQPSKTDRFTLTYEQFWDGFRRLASATRLIATTEPVLAGVLGLPEFVGPACGRSTIRVAPDGRILPCTYWPQSQLRLTDLQALGAHITQTAEFLAARQTSIACAGCPCRGGCSGRKALIGDGHSADPYCPFARHDRIVLDWEQVPYEELPKIGSACTTVVTAR